MLVFSTIRDSLVLFKYPVAVGGDGYYYVLQVDSLLHNGHLYYPYAFPVAFYFFGALAHAIGNTVVAVKLGTLISQLFLCLGAFALVYTASRAKWIAVVASSVVALSSLRMYLVVEYLKEALAVALLLWGFWLIVLAYRRRTAAYRLAAAVVLVAASFSHRSAPLLLFTVGACYLCVHILTTSHGWIRASAAITALAAFFGPLIVAYQTAMPVPSALQTEILSYFEWPIHSFDWVQGTLVLVLSIAALALVLKRRSGCTSELMFPIMGTAALMSVLITLNPFLNHTSPNVTARLGSLSFVCMAIMLAGLLRYAARSASSAAYATSIAVAPLVLASFFGHLPSGVADNYLQYRVQLVDSLSKLRGTVAPESIVLAPQGDDFVVSAILRVPSQADWPSAHYGTTYWLLRGIDPANVQAGMTIVARQDPWVAVMVDDAVLREDLRTMTPPQILAMMRPNPHLYVGMRASTPGIRPDQPLSSKDANGLTRRSFGELVPPSSGRGD